MSSYVIAGEGMGQQESGSDSGPSSKLGISHPTLSAKNVSSPMTCFTVCPGTCFTVFTRLRGSEASVRPWSSGGYSDPVHGPGSGSSTPGLVARLAAAAPTLRAAPWRFSSGRRRRRDFPAGPLSTRGLPSDTPSVEDEDRNYVRSYATRWPEFACPGLRADGHDCAPSDRHRARAAVLFGARPAPAAPVPRPP
jgi:hypothetical protein